VMDTKNGFAHVQVNGKDGYIDLRSLK
jgi:hypothetical protein